MDGELANELTTRFRVKVRPVEWQASSGGDAMQLIVEQASQPFYDPEQVRLVALAKHGVDGAECDTCGTWRWLPVPESDLPTPPIEREADVADIIASPEWFGDGWKSFHHVLVARPMALHIAQASPRDFEVMDQGPS